MIATALRWKALPLAVPGPYKVESGLAFGSPGLVVYRPADLTAFPAKDKLPVMVWGNGGCAINSTRYGGFLTTIASHGFLVLATAAEPGATGGRSTADHLRKGVDWAEAENKRAGSPLNGKVAVDRVAIMGQSCGGFLSIELGADPRVGTIGVFNSGVQDDKIAQLKALHGPVLLINGHERDFLMASSKATYDAIQDPARVLRRAPRRRTHGDRRPSWRWRVGQRRLELAAVAVQRRQAGREDVRREGLQPLHESELGYGVEAPALVTPALRGDIMRRHISFALLVAAAALATVFQQQTHGQAPRARSLPTFEVDRSWPKPIAKWKLGDASSFAIDAQDNVWLLHRPRPAQRATISRSAAPPVVVFDGTGNLLKAWGGAGAATSGRSASTASTSTGKASSGSRATTARPTRRAR
jgi:hypothetical protein